MTSPAGGEDSQSHAADKAPLPCDVTAGMRRYLGNLAGTQNLPRMPLVSEQHHVTVRNSSAHLINRLHHDLSGRAELCHIDVMTHSPDALWDTCSPTTSLRPQSPPAGPSCRASPAELLLSL